MKEKLKRFFDEKAVPFIRTLAQKTPLVLCLAAAGLVFLLIAGGAALVGGIAKKAPAKDGTQAAVQRQNETPAPSGETAEPTEDETLPEPTDPPEPENGKYIYLTFDDGPGRNTMEVLDILDRYGVKATFFTVGYYVDRYPETTAAIISRGQLIACHSYTHEYSQCYASADAFMEELEKWKQAVLNSGESLPDRICVRFPGGSRTPNAKNCSDAIKERLKAGGYRWFDWNAANCDKYPQGNTKKLSDAEYFWNSYVETTAPYDDMENPHVIFLTHDSVDETVKMLPRMIEDLLARGYTFRTLDQHPEWD